MDRRDEAWDPFEGSFNENAMVGLLYGDESDPVPVHCHWEVCDVCDGDGTHVNPSIDSHGISAEEMYEDEEFAESYRSGVYDVTCYRCHGRRVIPVPDEGDPNIDAYNDAVQSHHEMLSEMDAERRMGA